MVGARVRALRLRYGLEYGRVVQERSRFALNEALNRWKTASYRLRDRDLTISVRHHPSPHGTPSNDLWVLKEIFTDGAYRIPASVELPSEPTIVDLGANIGLFSAFMFGQYPAARITAFEPDRENASLLRDSAHRNGYGDHLVVHEACAMPWNGPVRFATGRHQFSHVAHQAEEGTVEVPGMDVFPFLRDVDLLKVDIEGGEWRLLADPRFGESQNVVLEYHPIMCPGTDPRVLVKQLLEERGYQIVRDDEPMVWAMRVRESVTSAPR